jgi:hypothetical protein
MIFDFRLFQNDNLLLEKTGEGNFQDVISIKSNGRNRIQFQMFIVSTEGVEIDLKCFKSIPPPPSFRPCPEAGTIKLPKHLPSQGVAQFSLASPIDIESNYDSVDTYNLKLTDYESYYNIFIHINP